MLLTVLTLLIIFFQISVIILGLKEKVWKIGIPIVLALSFGIFQSVGLLFSNPFCSICTNIFNFLPVGLLYGPTLLLLFHFENEKVKVGTVIFHLLPFLLIFMIFCIIITNAWIRYRYSLDYSLAIHFITLLHLATYLLLVKIRIAYFTLTGCKKTRLQKGVYFMIINVVILYIFLMLSISRRRTDMYFDQNFSLLIYFLFFIGLSLQYVYGRAVNVQNLEALIADNRPEPANVRKLARGIRRSPSFEIDDKKRILYKSKVDQFIDKLGFLEIDLDKAIFSEQLGIPFKEVSPFLRMEFGKTFTGFVNQLRLEYASNQLKEIDLIYSIEDLSLVCGFNSRASFYRNFRKEFGCSPHEFREQFIRIA